MSSERLIQASRANGALSHGPKTPAGKLRSARNSRRHGLFARDIVLGDEKPELFTRLLRDFEAELQPESPIEQELVTMMVVARWRAIRLWSLERSGLEYEISKHDPAAHNPSITTAIAFRSLCDDSRAIDLLNRFEARFDRQFARAFKLLQEWRAGKNKKCRNEPDPISGHDPLNPCPPHEQKSP